MSKYFAFQDGEYEDKKSAFDGLIGVYDTLELAEEAIRASEGDYGTHYASVWSYDGAQTVEQLTNYAYAWNPKGQYDKQWFKAVPDDGQHYSYHYLAWRGSEWVETEMKRL